MRGKKERRLAAVSPPFRSVRSEVGKVSKAHSLRRDRGGRRHRRAEAGGVWAVMAHQLLNQRTVGERVVERSAVYSPGRVVLEEGSRAGGVDRNRGTSSGCKECEG